MIFDTHAHYDDEAFEKDRDTLIGSLPEKGIGGVLNVGADIKNIRKGAELSERYPFVYSAVGIHPDECGAMNEGTVELFREMAEKCRRKKERAGKIIAVGEIGLDYHGFDLYADKPDKETQKRWFVRQLELAMELELPVVIHSRNACEDTLALVKEACSKGLRGGILHCFSYSAETALEYVNLGFYLGFGGSCTYEGQKKITKVLRAVPQERILLETDCPYLAPSTLRGSRNSSLNLGLVRDHIASILQISPAELEMKTWENARKALRLS